MPDNPEIIVKMALRWIHFLAGITWIGHLYFFNLVNGPFGKTMDGDTKKKVVPQLMPRALWWFRWGAMITVISGLLYMYLHYFVYTSGHLHGVDAYGKPIGMFNTIDGKWISIGGALGMIMWFNVWFIIWPNQKKIIAWVRDGQSPPEMAGKVKVAGLASRINTYLSVPMLFCMGARSHFLAINKPTVSGVFIIGFLVAWIFIQLSSKVATKL